MTTQKIDDTAFEILVNEHQRMIMAYALSLVSSPAVAEDLVQETFLTAYKKLSTFNTSKSFRAWLRGILRYKHLEYLRAVGKQPQKEFIEGLDEIYQIWDTQEESHIFDILKNCITKLPEHFKSVISLFYTEKVTGKEIAEQTDSTEESVRKKLQRARAQLKTCINNNL